MNTPKENLVFMFPGQGSQNKGMGKGLWEEFGDLVSLADGILGYSVADLCLNDPHGKLSLTEFTQPALYIVSVLSYLKEIQQAQQPDYLMGHSLGEYTALFAAGAFDFATGLRIVQRRGELMSRVENGGMAAVIGLSEEAIEALIANEGLSEIQIANFNSATQIVVSGNKLQIERGKDIFTAAGARAYIPLKVSGAFHSHKMQAVQETFEAFLGDFRFSALSTPVISNVTGVPYRDDQIAELLARQLASPVRWHQSVCHLLDLDRARFQEVGPGKVLSSLVRDIQKGYESKLTPVAPEKDISAAVVASASPVASNEHEGAFARKLKSVQTLRDLVDQFDSDKLHLTAISEKRGRETRAITYGELRQQARHLGNALLNLGVAKGHKVALFSENRWEWPASYLAIAGIGATVIPLDIFFSQQELERAVHKSGATVVITSKMFIHRVLELQVLERPGEQCPIGKVICFDEHEAITAPYLANFPSGSAAELMEQIEVFELSHEVPFQQARTIYFPSLVNAGAALTSRGKDAYSKVAVAPEDAAVHVHMTGDRFAVLSHQGLVANIYGALATLSDGGHYLKPGEVTISSLPFHHTFPTMGGFLLPLGSYLQVVILPRFSSRQFVKLAKEVKANYAVTVPFMIENIHAHLVKEKETLEDIRFLFTGGAPIHKRYLDGLDAIGCKVVQGYGLTEFSPIVTLNTPSQNSHGSIGRPILGVEVRIANPDGNGNGELWVKGPSIMKGYTDSDADTAAVMVDGWLRTGDIVRRDTDGSFFVTGRSKNIVVNKGGKNIYPEEIEGKILSDKYIAEARIIPRIDDVDGEVPAVLVLPNYEAIAELEAEIERTFSADELLRFIETKIQKATIDVTPYKLPKFIELIEKGSSVAARLSAQESEYFSFGNYYLIEPEVASELSDSSRPLTEAASHPLTQTVSTAGNASLEHNDIDKIRRYLAEKVASYVDLDVTTLETLSFSEAGLDSITMLNLKFDIERELHEVLPMRLLGENMTIAELAATVSVTPHYRGLKDSLLRVLNARKQADTDELRRLFADFMERSLEVSSIGNSQLEPLFLMLVSKSAKI